MAFARLRAASASPVAAPEPDYVLGLALRGGGDERLALDACDGRNAYGLFARPHPGETFFSSSTATSVSALGLEAAAAAFAALEAGARSPFGWFEALRGRVRGQFAPGRDVEAIFAPSGTDCESLAVVLAEALSLGPLTNLLVGPEESGRGVALAAEARHFLPSSAFGPTRERGARRAGWAGLDVAVDSVAIRDANGAPRGDDEIEAELFAQAEAALAQGRGLILHLLEGSKTGLCAPSLEAARQFAAQAPGKILLYADCCQARVSMARIGELLDAGCVVAVTGSKFFAGPPFSGALLLPGALRDRLPENFAPPEGLADFSSLCDWPPNLREKLDFRFVSAFNLGLGLRWEAALAEIERFGKVASPCADRIAAHFAAYAEESARQRNIALLASASPSRPILSFAVRRRDGAPADIFFAQTLQAALRNGPPSGGRKYHLGQPIAIGAEVALRLCLSAPQISEIAEAMAGGLSFSMGFAPLGAALDGVFAAWRGLLR